MIDRLKRSALYALLLLAAVNSWAFTEGDATPHYETLGPGQFKLISTPVLQNLEPDKACITWFTTKEGSGWIEYGETPELGRVARNSVDGLYDAGSALHRAFINELKPGTTYYYRTVTRHLKAFNWIPHFGKTVTGKTYSFTTPSESDETFRFAVFNDLHERSDIYEALTDIAVEQKCRLILLNGDSLHKTESARQVVKKIFLPARKATPSIPVLFTRGNHETRGRAGRELRNFIYTPEEGFYFHMKRAGASIVVLDGGEDKPDDHKEYYGLADFEGYRQKETLWLKELVESTQWQSSRFKIVMNHIPLWHKESEKAYVRSKQWQHDWIRILDDGKTDLVLSAHMHRYTKRTPGGESGHKFLQVIGGAPVPGKATAFIVTVEKERLLVEVYTDQGELLDSFEV